MKTRFWQKIKFWCFLTFFCCFWGFYIFFPLYTASSQTINNLKEKQQQVQQQRKNVIQEQNRLTNLQTEAQKNLTGIEQNLQTTNLQIQNSETRLKFATDSLQELEAAVATTQRNYEYKRLATVSRLRLLQRYQSSQGLAVLLQSQNLSDFISRRYQLKLVYQADKQILFKLAEQANLLIQQRINVETQKNLIAILREKLLSQKSDYQTQAYIQEELIQRLNSDRLALAAAQQQLEQDSEKLTVLIQKKIAEQKAKEARAKANRKIWTRGTGIFAFPSNAPTSSGFGWRKHPILGYRRFHAGLDFAASHGSTIRAADSGRIIFAGWYGGYGKAVIIDHGKGITTLYAHSSKLYVTEGKIVKRGEAIAAVGSTGLSTGPHLHFEVRRNGSPIDPSNFL